MPAASPPARTARILIVDDEALVRRSLKRAMRPHVVLEAASVEEALDILSKEHVDVILTDVHMPGMTGIDLYKALRASSPGMARNVMFLTGGVVEGPDSDFLNGIDNPTLGKPFDTHRIREFVGERLFPAVGEHGT